MSNQSNRRRFLKTTAMTGIGFWLAGNASSAEEAQPKVERSPNERIAFACIGVDGMGANDSAAAAKAGDVVAICDVDEQKLNVAGERRFPKAKRYTDFRKMLEEMAGSIDAVTVSTPDHIHAPAALMAMRLGKHCYCQKPLTRTIYEARLMTQVAKEKKLATQMGNQFTAHDDLRKAAAIIQSGVLGAVSEVHTWTNRPIWPQGIERPQPSPCPEYLHWDLWLGPSPERPYAPGYHPMVWRGWWDFGTGALGDMACHIVNMSYMALNLRNPVAVQAETSGHNKDSFPKWSIITYEFAALENRPALKLFWYDGGKRPADELFEGKPVSTNGCLIVGEKGKLYWPYDGTGPDIHVLGNIQLPEVKWVHSPGHYEEWFRAIRGGEAPVSNFADYSGTLTEVCLLGNLAVWVAASGQGERLEWDAANMRVSNVSGLEHLIKPTYRSGYTLDV